MSSKTGFCWLGFGMFHHPFWAVGSYNSGPPAGGTHQIQVNPTQVEDMGRPVKIMGPEKNLFSSADLDY